MKKTTKVLLSKEEIYKKYFPITYQALKLLELPKAKMWTKLIELPQSEKEAILNEIRLMASQKARESREIFSKLGY